MSTFTVGAKGQVTLSKDVLEHLGVRPGEKITVHKLPDGRVEVKAARRTGKISDVFGFLKKKGGPSLSIEDINKQTMKIAAGTNFASVVAGTLALLGSLITCAAAQDVSRSECLAMANVAPRITPVSLKRAAANADEVAITYAGHSTYTIDTPAGVRISTDYNGVYRTPGRLPDAVTMNRAHSTHYTLFPDPRIEHVLRGWGDGGQPARHARRVGDVFIRNVTTDIRRYFGDDSNGEMIKDGNSIFIFEVGGLCIGHLGHLHHKLDESHFAAIGRLDIVMVPIDGSYTMSLDGVSEITKRLRASVVLPMHRFATPLDDFMRRIGQDFVIDQRSERSLRISRSALPNTPTVIILDGV